MRFADFFTFQFLLDNNSLGIVSGVRLRDVLKANNIEHNYVLVNALDIDDPTVDSLLKLNRWDGETHCAVYNRMVIKSSSVGPTNVGNYSAYGAFCQVTLVRGLDMDQLVDLYKRSMKIKAFL